MTHCVHEDFIDLYSLTTIQASAIGSAIRDTLARLNLPLAQDPWSVR